MQSNTKLTAEQKMRLCNLREYQNDESVKIAHNGETTIAFKENGNTVEFALSVMSPNEKKFRPKVGEYLARYRFENMETVKMAEHNFYEFLFHVFGLIQCPY